jgi:hypothetical protein
MKGTVPRSSIHFFRKEFEQPTQTDDEDDNNNDDGGISPLDVQTTAKKTKLRIL